MSNYNQSIDSEINKNENFEFLKKCEIKNNYETRPSRFKSFKNPPIFESFTGPGVIPMKIKFDRSTERSESGRIIIPTRIKLKK